MLTRVLRMLLVLLLLVLPSTGHRGRGPGPVLVPLERRELQLQLSATASSDDGEWLHRSKIVIMPSWQAVRAHAAVAVTNSPASTFVLRPTEFTFPSAFSRAAQPPPASSLLDNHTDEDPVPLTNYFSSVARSPHSCSPLSSSHSSLQWQC